MPWAPRAPMQLPNTPSTTVRRSCVGDARLTRPSLRDGRRATSVSSDGTRLTCSLRSLSRSLARLLHVQPLRRHTLDTLGPISRRRLETRPRTMYNATVSGENRERDRDVDYSLAVFEGRAASRPSRERSSRSSSRPRKREDRTARNFPVRREEVREGRLFKGETLDADGEVMGWRLGRGPSKLLISIMPNLKCAGRVHMFVTLRFISRELEWQMGRDGPTYLKRTLGLFTADAFRTRFVSRRTIGNKLSRCSAR